MNEDKAIGGVVVLLAVVLLFLFYSLGYDIGFSKADSSAVARVRFDKLIRIEAIINE